VPLPRRARRSAFERASDNAIADKVGWLDFTHASTFANACRHFCDERPDLWPRAALQLALFVGRNRRYVRPGDDDAHWRIYDRGTFLGDATKQLYDHGIPEPIVACHRLKVVLAIEDELAAAPVAPWADAICAAVNRYLHTPMKRHHGLRLAAHALDLGLVRKLTRDLEDAYWTRWYSSTRRGMHGV
jgi:hypothetical protein